MDIHPLHIAKLVLGYLKLQKCDEAYTMFLNGSPHLKSFRHNTKRRKYISTRVHGQNLEDILKDYAKIYNIIEAAAEDTDFYKDKHHSKSIVDQLIYLLENKVPSRSTSPNFSSRCSTPNASDETSAIENSGELDATPLKSLPGNHRDDQSSSDGSRHKQKQRSSEDDANEDRNGSAHLETAIHAFAQTLLDHQELQEKIAANINIVRHTEPVNEKEKVGADDLDAAIKAVLDKTQSDPAFEDLIGDIIGSVADPPSSMEAEEVHMPQTTSTPHSCVVQEQQIVDQNNVAINSIISASQVNEQGLPITTPNRMDMNRSPDIILSAPMPSQPLLLNPSGLLMMKPNQSGTSTTVDAVKPFLVFNGPHIVNMPQQTESAYVNNLTILTEQDILNMPTVILRDDKDKNVITDPKPTTSKTKEVLEKSSELITLYKCDVDEDVDKNKAKVPAAKKKPATIFHVEIVNEDEPKASKEAPVKEEQTEKTPTEPTVESKSVVTPRSNNRSHIRALDFNFHTPNKESVSSAPAVGKKKSPKTKSAKSLFKSPDKQNNAKSKKSTSSWDSDLRALASSGIPTINRPIKKKPVVRRKVPESKAEQQPEPEVKKRLKTRLPKKVEIEAAEVKIEAVVENREYKIRNADPKLKYKKKCNVEVVLKTNADDAITEPQTETKFLTPEVVQPVKSNPIMSAKRNVIPTLETPVKEFNLCPKTPGFYSPLNAFDTPFTKVFKENFQSVDIASIPTPKFPLTPSLSFTPLMDGQSPHSNYSTSSSYYQPSDTEQSKSLESIIIEECKRLENKKIPAPPEPVKPPEEVAVVEKTIAEKFKAMSSNVIARKNLNLLKRKPESSGSSSEESSNDSSSDSSNESEHNTSNASKDRYSLRSKSVVEDPVKKKQGEITTAQSQVLKELEEKRKRTIAKFKSETDSKKKVKAKTPALKPAVKRNLRSNSKPGKIALELHLSSDEDNIQPMDVVETEMFSSKSTTPLHDSKDSGVTSFGNVLNNLESNIDQTKDYGDNKTKEVIEEKSNVEVEEILVKEKTILKEFIDKKKSDDKECIDSKNSEDKGTLKREESLNKNSEIDKKKPVIKKEKESFNTKKKATNKNPVNKIKILDNIKLRSPMKKNEDKIVDKETTENIKKIFGDDKKSTEKKIIRDEKKDDKTTVCDKKAAENVRRISTDCKKIIEDIKKNEGNKKITDNTKNKGGDNKKKSEIKTKSEDDKRKPDDKKKPEDNKRKSDDKPEDNRKKLDDVKKKSVQVEVDKNKEDAKKQVESKKRRSPVKKVPNLVPRSAKKKPEKIQPEETIEITKLENDKATSLNREEDLLAGLKQMGIHLVPNKQKPQPEVVTPKEIQEEPVEEEDELTVQNFTDHEIVIHGEYNHNQITYDINTVKPIKFKSEDNDTFMLSLGKFESLIDITSKIGTPKKKFEPIVILEQVHLPGKIKPLETLYKQLMNDGIGESKGLTEIKTRASSEIRTQSPLDNLYEEPKRRKSMCDDRKSEMRERSKSICESHVERTDMELEVCEMGSILIRENPVTAEDDLMNYAICGSERRENDCDKRKRQEDDGESEVKKARTDNGEELLKSVNVDDFLKQLHGE